GRTAVETYEANEGPRGPILLQQRDAQTVVHFRKVEIKEIVTSPEQAVELAVSASAQRGLAHAEQKQWPEAQEEFRRARALLEKATTEFPTRLLQTRALVKAHLALGALLLKANEKAEAAAANRQAVTVQETLETSFGGKAEYLHQLGQSHFEVAAL